MKENKNTKYKNKLKLLNDKQKWVWVKNNQDKEITVILDNDDTFIMFSDEEDFEIIYFDNHIGNAPGINDLLDLMNIKYERS